MGPESKTISVLPASASKLPVAEPSKNLRVFCEILIGFGFILAAIWTPEGPLKFTWMMLAVVSIIGFSFIDNYSSADMGLDAPPIRASALILIAALLLAGMVPVVANLLGQKLAPAPIQWHSAWQYVVWALVQEFILQSFIYLRLETALGSRRAVVAAAGLFALAHMPSPVLTACTFVGGLFFCEMFRRYRTIYPLGIAHGLLGLAIAASFSDSILHHMRVGIGYLMFHPHHLS